MLFASEDPGGHKMASRRHALWLLPASLGVAGLAIFGATYDASTVAQPVDDSCMNALAGLPDIASLFGPGVSGPGLNINSGNNISIQSGPNNVNPGQSASIGNDTSQNANNVSTCCVNGRCCVSTDGGPAICTP